MTTAAPPTTFGLSEEEQRLLRRTLRVIALAPDRLEIAVKERRLSLAAFVWGLPLFAFLTFFLCAVLVAPADGQAQLLSTLPLLALAYLLNKAIFPRYEAERLRSICLFAGTAWARGRRTRLPSYELLLRVEPTRLVEHGETRFDTRIILRTSVRQMVLKRRRFDEASTNACRALLARLVQACSIQTEASPAVELLAAKDAVPIELPHPWYAAIVNEDWLLSLTPNELAMKSAGAITVTNVLLVLTSLVDASAVFFALLPYLDPQRERTHIATLGCAMLLWRLLLLLVPRRTVELKRRERLVVVTRRGAKVEIPSQDCDVEVDLRPIPGDVAGSAWDLRLYTRHGRDPTTSSGSRLLGSWYLGLDGREDEPRARNAALAVRYYLNLARPDAGDLRRES